MENPIKDNNHWLKELANQSWNLELLISGAALFSTSFLPELVESFYTQFQHNFNSSPDLLSKVLPSLAYAFAMAASYLLIFTFSVHFIMRAFWIGLVGLKAVYPEGINYDNIPNTNAESKDLYKKQFKSLDHFILNLDKICSITFSIAFILVLMCIMIAFAYINIFIILVGVKTYFIAFYPLVKKLILTLFIVFMATSLIIYFLVNNKKTRDLAITGKLQKFFLKINALMLFGMYKPFNYINLVFASNLSRKKYYTGMTFFMVVFMVLAMSINVYRQTQDRGINLLESRKYFSEGTTEFFFNQNQYDNQRPEGQYVALASIQSDIIEDPYIKLFINYPKLLDYDLSKICQGINTPDSLKKYKRRLYNDSTKIQCLENYFQISLNDSIVTSKNFYFTENNSEKGLITYISSENCKSGQNQIKIKTLRPDSLPKKVWIDYDLIPFWYKKD